MGIGLLILAGFGSMMLVRTKAPAARTPNKVSLKQVQTFAVKNRAQPTTIEITGRLAAREKIELYAEVGGMLLPESSRFREGNFFKQGSVLIAIDSREARLALLAQKSSLMNQITLMLPDLKTDYPESFPQWEGYLRQLDLEKNLPELPTPVSDREKYYVSARNIFNLYYNIQSQETRLEKYLIKAPFNGVVAEANIKEGTLVRVGQKMGDFFNPYSYELEAALNLSDLAFVKVGDPVTLSSGDIDGTWKGILSRISDRIDPNTQTAKVFVNLSGNELREGMYLSGSVRGRDLDRVVEIPRYLLIDQRAVYGVKDSLLVLHQIEPVKYTTETVLVRGLADGVELLGENFAGAFEGMKVAPNLVPAQ
ncbi:MAG: efflux RND transporter periplasmic adaptor subunit [Bacteroidia bacterium]